jgi:hypothetical protein
MREQPRLLGELGHELSGGERAQAFLVQVASLDAGVALFHLVLPRSRSGDRSERN